MAKAACCPPPDVGAWIALMERARTPRQRVGAMDRTMIEVFNPASGQLVGRAAKYDATEMCEAIGAASAALPSWRRRLPRERGDILMEWRRLILANADALAALIRAEQGKPLGDAQAEILYGAEFIRWFAEEPSRAYGEVIPSHLPSCQLTVQRQPVRGVGL